MLFTSSRLFPTEPSLLPIFDFEIFFSFVLRFISFLGLSYGTDLNLQSSSAIFLVTSNKKLTSISNRFWQLGCTLSLFEADT